MPSTETSESRVIRVFKSAVHPDDVDEVVRLFEEDVKPVFENLPGCISIQLLMEGSRASTGLVEGAVLTMWESKQALERALGTEAVENSQRRIRRLLRVQPIVTEYVVLA